MALLRLGSATDADRCPSRDRPMAGDDETRGPRRDPDDAERDEEREVVVLPALEELWSMEVTKTSFGVQSYGST